MLSIDLTWIATLCVSLSFLYYFYAKYKLSYWKRLGVKSLPTHLIFGNFQDTLTFKSPPGKVVQDLYENCDADDPFVGFYVFHRPKLLLRDLSLMKQFMIKDFDAFPNRNFGGETQLDSVGLINLLGIHQPRWKYLRQKLTPCFTGSKLRGMLPLIKKCGVPLLKFVENSRDSESDGNWKSLEFKDLASRYTTDVLASLAFGVTTDSFNDDPAFWRAGQKILAGFKRGVILIVLFFLPHLTRYIERHIVGPANYFRTMFWQSMRTRENGGAARGDLIDHLIKLKNGEQIEDYKFEGDNLLSQALSFYVAGFEASSTTIAFALYELSLHKECEEKLYEEIARTLDGVEEPDADLINGMDFLNQVVNETLRLYPPLPIIDRVAVKDYKIPGSDVTIVKGTPVYISINGTNRDPKYFDRPNDFIPTRSRLQTDDLPSSSLAFGIGPRSCIGQRLGQLITKVALITILKEYELSNEHRTEKLLKPTTVFTAAADGLCVKLKKRNLCTQND